MGPSFIDPPSHLSSTPHPIPPDTSECVGASVPRPALLHSDVSPHVGGGEREGTCGSAPHRPPSPAVSFQPMDRFRFWMAWPAAPFTRLSRAEKTTARPGAP